jgi:hypothetical protein
MSDSKIKSCAKEPGFNLMLDLATRLGSSSATMEILRSEHGEKGVGEDIYTVALRLGNAEAIEAIRENRRRSGDPLPLCTRNGHDTILDCAYLLASSEPIVKGRNNGNKAVRDILNLRRDSGIGQIGGVTPAGTHA